MQTQNSTVKSVFSGLLKIDKTKDLMEIGSLMKVESIAESTVVDPEGVQGVGDKTIPFSWRIFRKIRKR